MRTACFLVAALVATALAVNPAATAEKDTPPEKEAVAKLLVAYFETEFESRGKYVLDSKDFAAGQATLYKDALVPEGVKVKVAKIKACVKDGLYEVTAAVEGKLGPNPFSNVFTMYMSNTKDGLKLDWGATTGYNPTAYKTWAAGDDAKVTLRVEAELADYYNFHYSAVASQ